MLKENEIKRLIEDDALSDKKRMAKEGQRYYEGEHDILQYRMFYYNTDGILLLRKSPGRSWGYEVFVPIGNAQVVLRIKDIDLIMISYTVFEHCF